MPKKRLAVFVSGRGSNLIAIHKKILKNEINGEIVLIISNKEKIKALEYAKKYNIDHYILVPDSIGYIHNLKTLLKKYKVNFILLAGYLKKIPEDIVKNYKWKILNIHPALLPKFGGKGMYGINVHKAVIEAKEKESGVTIHFIDEKYDKGLIIAQKKVKVLKNDTPETLAKRVLKVEHKLYPEVVKLLCENKIKIKNNKVIIKE